MSGHRWSGYLGAWCLDCGIEHTCEVCIGTEHDTCGPGDEECKHPDKKASVVGPCPEPGSNRHNPYVGRRYMERDGDR